MTSYMPPTSQKFDQASGLQYTETIVAFETNEDRDWLYRPKFLGNVVEWQPSRQHLLKGHYGLKSLRNGNPSRTGTRSLQDIAIDSFVQNISQLTSEALACLPVIMVMKLWDVLRKRAAISFHAFTLFSQVLSKDRMSATTLDLLKYRTQIAAPKSHLSVYTAPLTSKTFEFLTVLSITKNIHLSDAVKLSSISNLIALEIVAPTPQPGTGVSDRVIRAWSHAVETEGAFPVLRLLKLWNHEDVTDHSLLYIGCFPVLAVYDVRSCMVNMEHEFYVKFCTQCPNWRFQFNINVLSDLEEKCTKRGEMRDNPFHQNNLKSSKEAISRPFLDNAEVNWMARSKAPALQAQLISVEDHLEQTPFSPIEPWDFSIYASLCKIGELRDDHDLLPHVDLNEQALVGGELIISHPVVSFRLGETLSCLSPRFTHDTRICQDNWRAYQYIGIQDNDLTFLRIDLPEPKVSTDAISPAAKLPEADTDRNEPESKPMTKPRKRTNILMDTGGESQVKLDGGGSGKSEAKANKGVPKGKRRKLEDVLSAFL